jgi:hypothetical protein
MSSKLKFLIPAIAAGAVVAGGGAYYFLKVQPAQNVANPLSSFQILPQETVAAGYFSLDENTWEKANKFGTPEARDLINQQYEAFKTNLNVNSPSGKPLNFDQDIKPWVGSVAVAGVITPDKKEVAMVLVVGIKDKLEALKFATKQKDNADDQVTISKFKGVDIYEFEGDSPQFLTLLDNHLVLSEQKSQVESVITVEQGATSVMANAEIKNALQESITLSNPMAVGFVDPSRLTNQALEISPEVFKENLTLPQDLESYQAVTATLGIEPQGFRLKNVVKQDLAPEWSFDPLPGKVIDRFPENTLALIHTGYINKIWDLAIEGLDRDPKWKEELDNIRKGFTQATQLDLEADVLSWMDGELGVGVVPVNDGLLAQVGLGGAIAIQTSDRPTAEATLTKLNDLAQSSGAQVQQQEIGGISMTQWGIPLQSALVNYGWVDESTLLFSLGESTATALTGDANSSVKQNAIFKSLTGTLPTTDRGLFYLNLEAMVATVRSGPTLSSNLNSNPELDAVLDSLEGLVFTGQQPDRNTVIGDMLLTFRQE